MNSYAESDVRRLLGVLRRQPVDRVPNYEVLIGARTVRHVLARADADWMWALAPEDQLELVRRIGQDVMIVPVVEWGLAAGDEGGRAYEGNIRDRTTLARAGGWDDERHIQPAIRRIQAHRKAAQGTRIGICAGVGALIFDRTVYALGFENFMTSVYTDSGFVEEVMERYTDYAVALMRAICRQGVDIIHAGDDVAHKTGLFVAPDLFRRLWFERMRRVVNVAHEHNIPFLYHSDGCLSDVLPLLIELGVVGVNPIEPYSNDITRIKHQYGDRLTLIGNIDISTLSHKPQAVVRAETRARLRDLMPGGGWVASSSHSITDDVIPENFLAMIQTVQEEGRYA